MIDNLIKKLIQKLKSKYYIYKYEKWYAKVSKIYENNDEAYRDFIEYLRSQEEYKTNLFFQLFVGWGDNYLKYKDNPELLNQKQEELILSFDEKVNKLKK